VISANVNKHAPWWSLPAAAPAIAGGKQELGRVGSANQSGNRDNSEESSHPAGMKIIFTITLIAASLAMSALSCASVAWAANDAASPEPVTVTGFDSAGEPEIRSGENGALEIMFNFMPPLDGADDANPHPVFETFEKVLSTELGVEVRRDDRELFIIPKPAADTAARAKAFLETFWRDYFPKLEGAAKPPG
jgi:hypothetical protein